MAELTMSEALKDPLIRLMLRADRISLGEFAAVLENASRHRNRQHAVAGRVDVERNSVTA